VKELLSNPGFIALMGTLFGGAGLEIVRRLMDRRQRDSDNEAKMRLELRTEIEGLHRRLAQSALEEQRLEAEIDRWKGMFYEQKEDYLKSMTALQILTERLNDAHLRVDIDPPQGE
jgi:hypothetical protein